MYRDEGRGYRDAADLDMASTATLPVALRAVSLEVEHRVGALVKIAPSTVPVLSSAERPARPPRPVRTLLRRRSVGRFVSAHKGLSGP